METDRTITCIQTLKKFFILNIIILIIVHSIFLSSNVAIINGIHNDLDNLHHSLDIKNATIEQRVGTIIKLLNDKLRDHTNLEEKIFNLIFNKFYRKNNTITVIPSNI